MVMQVIVDALKKIEEVPNAGNRDSKSPESRDSGQAEFRSSAKKVAWPLSSIRPPGQTS
ncbi:MAG: hypothetical protein HQL86_06240 [Magnetococcales bacterium]|nr:hypothetical protein [Magnetococcales bacterium]